MNNRISITILGLFFAIMGCSPAAAVQLDAKKIVAMELRGVSLLTTPADAAAILSGGGFETIEIDLAGRPAGTQRFRRVDPLLGDVEIFDIEQESHAITRIIHNRTYPKSTHPRGSWKNYVHVSEIEYALALLCDTTAVDSRDCKDSAQHSAADIADLRIQARRVGDFQQKLMASFWANHAGYTWEIKRATMNE